MAVENSPVTIGGIIGLIFFYMLNAILAERKTPEASAEEKTDPGVIAKNAVGAAFVDKATAEQITQIAGDVRVIRTVVEDGAKREAEEANLEKLADIARGSVEHALNHKLEDLRRILEGQDAREHRRHGEDS